MVKLLKKQNGQAMMTEYAITIVIVIATLTAMGLFVRRAVQGRFYDAKAGMVKRVYSSLYPPYVHQFENASQPGFAVYPEYEPYYSKSVAKSDLEYDSTTRILPVWPTAGTGDIKREAVENRHVDTDAEQLSPKKSEYKRLPNVISKILVCKWVVVNPGDPAVEFCEEQVR